MPATLPARPAQPIPHTVRAWWKSLPKEVRTAYASGEGAGETSPAFDAWADALHSLVEDHCIACGHTADESRAAVDALIDLCHR